MLVEIVRRRFPSLWAEADDVAQDVLLRLADPALRARVCAAPAALLSTILTNAGIDELRRRGRFRPDARRIARIEQEIGWLLRDRTDAESVFAEVERREQLLRMRQRLEDHVPEEELFLLWEHHGLDRPTKDLASTLRKTDTWVRTRLSRSLRRVRRSLGLAP